MSDMAERLAISFTLNGHAKTARVTPETMLAAFIRDECGLTGTKIGCDQATCGACTVLVDGAPTASCSTFAWQADGATVTTIEGLAVNGALDPVYANSLPSIVPGVTVTSAFPGFVNEIESISASPRKLDPKSSAGGVYAISGFVGAADPESAIASSGWSESDVVMWSVPVKSPITDRLYRIAIGCMAPG